VADSQFNIDPAGVAAVLRGPNGPVARRAIEDGELVKREAQRIVGVKTGRLRDTIVKRMSFDSNGITVYIGSPERRALIHHEGTQPHLIEPARAKVLSWVSGGVRFFAARVHHPGTRPNRFLVNALNVLRGRY
jgi:hypothetical protein